MITETAGITILLKPLHEGSYAQKCVVHCTKRGILRCGLLCPGSCLVAHAAHRLYHHKEIKFLIRCLYAFSIIPLDKKKCGKCPFYRSICT